MSITAGEDILASDFIDSSSGASDSGKVAKLDSDGVFDRSFYKYRFGGDGSDGALSISSGTTTIDASGAEVVVKQYTSISITGTAKLTISNKNANGTILILLSQGNVTITSSGNSIDLDDMGADQGNRGVGIPTFSNIGSNATDEPGTQAGEGIQYVTGLTPRGLGYPNVTCGSGGGNGYKTGGGFSGTQGVGGKGGGALIIECAGALNFTGTISTNGEDGTDGSGTWGGGGGGGGGGGDVAIIYATLTANSGTIDTAGGAAGSGAGSVDVSCSNGGWGGSNYNKGGSPGLCSGSHSNGGAGATGKSYVIQNTAIL